MTQRAPRRAAPAAATSRNGPVETVRRGINDLSPQVRAKAMRLAGGDARRVEVIDRDTAIVR